MLSSLRPWSLLVLSLLVGCGGAPPPQAEAPTTTPSEPLAATEPPPAPKRSVPEGHLRREDVMAVLSDGPPVFLQKIDVEPALDGQGRFQGWRVMAIRDPDMASGEVRQGDVVTRINGRAIENPFQFFDVFQSLAFASELRVSLQRGAEQRELRYPINDDPNAPPMPRTEPRPSADQGPASPAATPAAAEPPAAGQSPAAPPKKAKKGKK